MNIRFIILFIISFIAFDSYACHDVTITETSATDNGDGTYTYTFDLCFGTDAGSETYGFWLDFTGGNLIDYNDSIIGPSTGNVKYPSVPPISGSGTIEYGDWDDTTDPLLSGTANLDCLPVTFTFDAPLTDATFGGVQPAIGCAPIVINTTSCFGQLTVNGTVTDVSDPCTADGEITATADNGFAPYTYSWDNGQTGATTTGLEAGTYTVTITDDQGCTISDSYTVDSPGLPDYTVLLSSDCNGNNNAEWVIDDPDGNPIGSGSQTTGESTEYIACGCGATFTLNYDNNCTPVEAEVFDIDGNPLGTVTQNEATISLGCNPLPITLGSFKVSISDINQMNDIKWVTLSETNNDYFILEYSNDGIIWSEIERIDGAGNSTSENSYKISHRSINDGVDYYRLKQVDTNGEINDQGIRSIDNNDEKELVKKINLIGQEVDDNYEGVVIEYYDDGTTIKRYQ